MFASPTTYRSGVRTVEVLPGESHSDVGVRPAWWAVPGALSLLA